MWFEQILSFFSGVDKSRKASHWRDNFALDTVSMNMADFRNQRTSGLVLWQDDVLAVQNLNPLFQSLRKGRHRTFSLPARLSKPDGMRRPVSGRDAEYAPKSQS
jgi:hypothetical protein